MNLAIVSLIENAGFPKQPDERSSVTLDKGGPAMLKDIFTKQKPKKRKYATIPSEAAKQDVPEGIMTKCPACKKILFTKELIKNNKVCLHCEHHHPMTAFERLHSLVDEGSFQELDESMSTLNPLHFTGYEEKIAKDQKKTNMKEAVLTGSATLDDHPFALAIMDSSFRMASMGSVVGEKITRAIEYATKRGVPFVIFTASGGARMQEGALSLMQMAKTSAALKAHSEQGLLSIVVMTHPTTGGVSASFASLGDYNFAEPRALIGFAGRRVIEQTVREELPQDFQTSEFLLKHGQLDDVVHRNDLHERLAVLFALHREERHVEWLQN